MEGEVGIGKCSLRKVCMWGGAHVREPFIMLQIQKPAPKNWYKEIDAKQ